MNRRFAKADSPPKSTRRNRRLNIIAVSLLLVLVIVGVARALLPEMVLGYVNRTLDRSPRYAGRIENIQIHLWRGAYSIQGVRISKTSGDVPVPFFTARRVAFVRN